MNRPPALFWMLFENPELCSYDCQRSSWSAKQKAQTGSTDLSIYGACSVVRRKLQAAGIAVAAAFLSACVVQAQGPYTAVSCNYSDVNAVINGPTHTVQNGDTIQIPAGTCTWTSSLTPPAGISFTLTGAGSPNNSPSTFGAGALSTTIIDNAGTSGPLINVTGLTPGGSTMHISTLDIEPTNAQLVSPLNVSGTCNSSACPKFRIDNIGFGLTTPWREQNVGILADSLIRTDNVFGVIDHCTNPSGNYSEFVSNNQSAYLGVGGYGDNSWAQPDSTGTDHAVFVENNSFYNANTITETEFGAYGGGIGGSRQVGRFNQIVSQSGYVSFSGHGLESDGRPRGIRQIEAYNNTVSCPTSGTSCNTAVASFRSGGTGYVFNNNVTAATGADFGPIFEMNAYRTIFTASPWGACGGSAPWDTDDGITYYSGTVTAASNPSSNYGWNLTMTDTTQNWSTNQFTPTGAPFSVYDVTQGWWGEIQSNTGNTITVDESIGTQKPYGFNTGDSYQILRATVCGDQAGRGQGVLISGQSPTPGGPLNEALDPVYEWNDTAGAGVYYVASSSTLRIIANRDWYAESMNQTAQTSATSPFNGTSGTGHGTLANRPSTCTTGTGYWATDQGNWNQSGLSCTGTGAGQGCQGELFKCTATNTWTLAYTPYTYPHPLVSGASSATTPPPPTNLVLTVQ